MKPPLTFFALAALAILHPPQAAASGAVEAITIRDGIEYVRIADLGADVAAAAPALGARAAIFDLRFASGDLDSALRLGGLLARAATGIISGSDTDGTFHRFEKAGEEQARSATTLVLVNQETAGPIEAVLDALQASGDIVLVGTRSAGATDLRRRGGDSLREHGVEPRLPVEISAREDREAYATPVNETTLAQLLDTAVEKPRFDEAQLLREHSENGGRTAAMRSAPVLRAPAADEPTAEPAPPLDRILNRAVNTILAAEALGKL